MKYLLCVLLLALGTARADDLANCTSVARTAELVMQTRQMNVDAARLYAAVEPTDKDGIARALITDAYSRPLMRMPANQAEAVATFRNDAFIACMASR